ncbi:GNAT family N-acetyltransferase [Chryseobacterium proteolyticum]|uniref:GNAT family N-acetyltransferase n=1 Tax=Chryseobacterium proteolyticum TaxID=118127 RepID=UPI003982E950
MSNPDLVTDKDCEEFLFERGKGWVCEINDQVVGFSIVDLKENNIWALFVHPDFEGLGVGQKLHHIMLDWYFQQTKKKCLAGNSF